MRSFSYFLFILSLGAAVANGQVLSKRPILSNQGTPQPSSASAPTASIPLEVSAGTPLKIALDKEVRIQRVGQPIHGKVVEPVYSFDKLVVPVNSEVTGTVVSIDGVTKIARTVAVMNANFSPDRAVHIEFDDLVLADGRHFPIQTIVSAASQGVLQFVPATAQEPSSKVAEARSAASRKVSSLRRQVREQWDSAKQQLHDPGKVHKLERLAIAQLPYHPQYMDVGTMFNADLEHPLNFGSETLFSKDLSTIGNAPPPGCVVHALLVTPLNSATTKKGVAVDAIISQPLMVSDKLFLPQGSHLKGSVLAVQPARRLGRNGQLRVVFHQVIPPDGIEQRVEASLEGVEVSRGEHLSLDSEGGAQVTTPRTRYLTTAIAVALAASSASPDEDRGLRGRDGGGDGGGGALNGASGFKLIGTLIGAFAHSRIVSTGLGSYGAAMSIYSHFLARGRDVVYPKDMSMVIGFGGPRPSVTPVAK